MRPFLCVIEDNINNMGDSPPLLLNDSSLAFNNG